MKAITLVFVQIFCFYAIYSQSVPYGLVDQNTGLSQVVLPNNSEISIQSALNTPFPKVEKLPYIETYRSTHSNLTNSHATEIKGLFQLSQQELKRKNPEYNQPIHQVNTVSLDDLKKETPVSRNKTTTNRNIDGIKYSKLIGGIAAIIIMPIVIIIFGAIARGLILEENYNKVSSTKPSIAP
jgi:hypothetical protein